MIRRIRNRKFESRFNDSEKGINVLAILNREVSNKIRGGGDDDYFYVQSIPGDVDQIELFSTDEQVTIIKKDGHVIDLNSKLINLSFDDREEYIAEKIMQIVDLFSK